MSDDAQAIAELAKHSNVNKPHTILHYLYLPHPESSSAIVDKLRHRGLQIQERLGADGVNWLVPARQMAVPTEALMVATRQFMEALVAEVEGEYDAWEAEVRNDDSGSVA